RHDLREATGKDLPQVRVVKAERTRIHVLVPHVDARLYAGEEVIADASLERRAIELLRHWENRIGRVEIVDKVSGDPLIDIFIHERRHDEALEAGRLELRPDVGSKLSATRARVCQSSHARRGEWFPLVEVIRPTQAGRALDQRLDMAAERRLGIRA